MGEDSAGFASGDETDTIEAFVNTVRGLNSRCILQVLDADLVDFKEGKVS